MQPSYGLLIESQGVPARKLEFALARVVIGRDAGDLVLPDSQISTTHAELLFDGRGLVLRDLGSTNGTWINGQRITSLELQPGMSMQIGQQRITFLGLVGVALGRGRTVAVQQQPQPWQAPLAASPPQPWQTPPAAVPPQRWAAPIPAPAPVRPKRSGVGTVLVVLVMVLLVGVLGLGGLGWYLKSHVSAGTTVGTASSAQTASSGSFTQTSASKSAAPSGSASGDTPVRPGDDKPYAQANFGTRAFFGRTVTASTGKDRKSGGRVVELHAAASPLALQTRSEVLSLGLRGDRPGTYAVGPTQAALSFSVGDDEHYLARPGVSVKIDRFDPNGEVEGSFAGEFEHEVAGTVRETVSGKGSFRAQFP